MLQAFENYFKTLIKHGNLAVEVPDGTIILGDGAGPDLAIRINDRRAVIRLLRNPALAFGELYMEGRIVVLRGTLFDVLALASRSILESGSMDWTRILDVVRRTLNHVRLGNGMRRARKNVAHHYNLDERFYRLFLDRDMQYSCGYFADATDSLDVAQLAKKRRIAAKLAIEPGQRVLDIGCGWGGMALYLARYTGASVRGITLSSEQRGVAQRRAREVGLDGAAAFVLEDYRETSGRFDRIVSVGMLEHVGRRAYRTYFQRIADLLENDGVALVHTIGRSLGPAQTNQWLLKYIFPGGYIPALSELMPAIEQSGLFVTDIETLRLHYAETIRAWRESFAARRDEARALYDERFCRMWELYLCGAESSFRVERQVVVQIQLAKTVDGLPLTRNYMAAREELLRQLDTAPPQLRVAGGSAEGS